MFADLIRAVLAAAAAAVLPGYFWAAVLRPTSGLGERLAYSTAVSMGSVPILAVIIARAAGTGVTLWVALLSVLIVFGAGLLVFRIKGPATGEPGPLLSLPAPARDPRVLTLVAAALALALVTMAERRPPVVLLALIALALLAGGALLAWPRPAPEPGDGRRPIPVRRAAPALRAAPPVRRGPHRPRVAASPAPREPPRPNRAAIIPG